MSAKSYYAGDPFCGHEWKMKQKSTPPSRTPPGTSHFNTYNSQEMQNPSEIVKTATDPFMTKFGANNNRPRIKVSIFHARDLDHGEKCEPYVTVHIPGVPKSRLNTPVDYQHWGNPVWNFEDKQVWGWVPGKSLQFEVKNKGVKEGSGLATMFGTAEDQILGVATLTPDQYWPKGFKGELQLQDQYGNLNAGKLWVAVDALGGTADRNCCSSICETFGVCGRSCGSAFAAIPRHLGELLGEFQYLLGAPYPIRRTSEMLQLILIPFFTYYFIVWLICLLRHVGETAIVGIVMTIVIISATIAVWGATANRLSQGLPFSTLGCLCLLAVFLGIVGGNHAWSYSWRQWWWMRTGHNYGGNSATTPAAARSDAAWVSFANAGKLVSVDASRAAGFRRGDIYCAAPILDPNSTNAEIMRVNYWAIGINCCDDFGSFTCDTSREQSANVGVVMIGNGMPSAGENSEFFRLAAEKSNGAYKMVSSPFALYVRYVKDVSEVGNQYSLRGVWVMFKLLFLGLLILGAIGWLANYKGWGKPPRVQVREPKVPPAEQMQTRRKEQPDPCCGKPPRLC